ncbi:MAG: extracellular solute-binding protein [Roseburia sp.]|nr:extracellular solute-binding protein [Roseburia sp.]
MKRRKIYSAGLFLLAGAGTAMTAGVNTAGKEDVITLRVCNWEEYMDLGEWDEEERITLENGVSILGERPLYEEFEDWYRETYGREVRVEYSCFGTNEDLYNQLTLGDTYDLVCPSEYMIMKLMAEGELQPYSEGFYDRENEYNYYINGVSPYIYQTLSENEINGESWSKYAAGYMWGITGVLYNPEKISEEEASTWTLFDNPAYNRQVTLKDNVRDSYFAALGALKSELLTQEQFLADADYREKLGREMNDVSPETIEQAQRLLADMVENSYSLETDSGKADMITGKIVANYQWSGDAVYAMDQAQEDEFYLKFAVPRECTNLWFDGWVMLKNGIDGDAQRQQAAEAFVNFVSRSDNAVRNMSYIGYTSSIAGAAGDDTVFDYLNWCYGADEEEADVIEYPVGYFFTGDNTDMSYVITASAEQADRQLYAQYPSWEVIRRSAVMEYFDEDANKAINRMWINVRCFNISEIPVGVWALILALLLAALGINGVRHIRR